jgi:hypothetical protein
MPNKAEFKIAYDGDALKSHTMDVRELAPALLAFGKLFDETNRVVNDNQTTARLKVKATSPASFDIFFQLDQTYASQVTNLLTGDGVTSAVNLIAILGFGTATLKAAQVTLLSLIRFLRAIS